ncbi:fluoride efflux transporter FluC [Limimaricola hongkongensis]|uniref:Fluoride-specific ion channel FluC n=1 Tax=Limimaricola hongkongensis DSM 17492 TaxID=1122180 RepID=A0A017HH01_9RHOB|nr:CrcB family protein [Limimaricola hongkongensis]EYD73448.1 putative crcB protein [Limimaricola hongkongensis DSM 17492]
MMTSLALVAMGGATGASLRFLVGQAVAFPMGTLAVNVTGSLAIGALWVLLEGRAAQLAPLLVTGLLGGFTTFSAFSLDALRLAEAGRGAAALAYVAGSVILSIMACASGLWIARSLS